MVKKYYAEILMIILFVTINIIIVLGFQAQIETAKRSVEQAIAQDEKKEKEREEEQKKQEEKEKKEKKEKEEKEEKEREKKEEKRRRKGEEKRKKEERRRKEQQRKKEEQERKELLKDEVKRQIYGMTIDQGIGEGGFKEYYEQFGKFDEDFIEEYIVNGSYSDPNFVIDYYRWDMMDNYSKVYNIDGRFDEFLNIQIAINSIFITKPCHFKDDYWNAYFSQFYWANFDYDIPTMNVKINKKWMVALKDALVNYRKDYFSK